ncbi:MAG: DUF5985 family protein [Vulcanimicrobiaceae bacterium]
MAEVVYILAALTSAACAFLLLRSYARTHVPLLLWSGIAFVGFTINNVLVYLDLVVLGPEVDLSVWRLIPTLLGLIVFCYGLIWEAA